MTRKVFFKTMNRNPTGHGTRLTILFIAAILIPGGFLAYFSIQNIGSQRELAEKRLLDEEGNLAVELGRFLQDELLGCATAFFDAADQAYPDLREIVLTPEHRAYVALPFALDRSGEFLWPRYENSDAADSNSTESIRYSTVYAQALEEEFAAHNPADAVELYTEAAEVAQNAVRRAEAVSGLARVLLKSSQIKRSVEQYEILLEHYGGLSDDNGIPFARYAIHQLMRISGPDPTTVARRISALLSRLENGKMPLNNRTETLLQEIEEWLESNSETLSSSKLIKQQISYLRNQLAFIARSADRIAFLNRDNPGATSPLRLGPFDVIAGGDLNGEDPLVTRRDANGPEVLGFQVNTVGLRNALLEKAPRIPSSVALEVSLTSDEEIYPANDSTTLVRELSPLFHEWRVMVRPHDPEIISKYVSRQHWIYGATLVLLVSGMVLGIVLTLQDLSRERRLSQLRTDFVTNVTHELKTPLTSIRMFAETLRMRRAQNEAEQKECLDVIVGETQRLSRLINTVLDFSKIERGQKQYRMTEVDISNVAQSALNTLKGPLKEQGFSLDVGLESGIRVVGDADALEQAMLNLIDNAIKYSRQNKSIRFNLWGENNSVFFSVADRGIGIPETEKNRIFEKFYRASAGNGLDTGGAGLGLTVVRHIVEAHDGAIEVSSRVGEGSTFTVRLPGIAGKQPGKAGNS
jgi:signal transduction histidine kinase